MTRKLPNECVVLVKISLKTRRGLILADLYLYDTESIKETKKFCTYRLKRKIIIFEKKTIF